VPLFLAALVLGWQEPTTPDALLTKWGVEAIEQIRRDFYMPASRLYAEEVTLGEKPKQVAFNWGVGVMLSALNSAAQISPKYRPWLEEYATEARVYWNDKGPVPGYDVLPCPKPVDRYYDDNAWMVMVLADTYSITGDRKYLNWASEALEYVMSGEDKARGGGIYWRESDKGGKGTCSNAPTAAACLAIYRHTRNPKHLADAKRIYHWTKKHLQDPADHLFWDAISNEGKVDRTKWSYNTALMIRSAVDLFAITKSAQYMTDLKQMQSASAKKWLSENVKDEGRFAHLLLDSWLYQRERVHIPRPDLGQADFKAFLTPLAWLNVRGRNFDGYYGKRFDKPPPADQKTFALIDQASAARAYFNAALYFRTRP
jgi:hypothetical protein